MKRGKLVSLVKGNNRKENIGKALSLIKTDLADFKKARRVLLKPNLTSAYNLVANTSPQAIEAILEFFEQFDAGFDQKQIVVAESSGEAVSRGETMAEVYRRFGFEKRLTKWSNVILRDFNQSRNFLELPIETLLGKSKVRLVKEVFDFDYKISVTLPKTHDTVMATLGIKNFLMGIVKHDDRGLMHGIAKANYGSQETKLSDKSLTRIAWRVNRTVPWRFSLLCNYYLPANLKNWLAGFDPDVFLRSALCLHRNLLFLGKKILPDLVVIDGLWGMEGDGPVYGRKKKLGVAIASVDPVKADGVGARAMGFDPEEISYLWLLAKAGKGDLSTKGLVGEKISGMAIGFLPHRYHEWQRKVREND